MSPSEFPRKDKGSANERPISWRAVELFLSDAERGVELIRQPTPRGEGNRDMRLSQIQEQVGRGEYQVDAQAVADAILRRLLEGYNGGAFQTKRGPAECS
jgi:anti-sigma28 factor (negative regulator of flagellin synthesis)